MQRQSKTIMKDKKVRLQILEEDNLAEPFEKAGEDNLAPPTEKVGDKPLSSEMVKQINNLQSEANPSSPQILLKTMLQVFYDSNPFAKTNRVNPEVEVKFGTRGIKYLTRIDYDNVIKKLKSSGFTCTNEAGNYYLRIYSEFLDTNTGKFKLSQSIRTEITGFQAIQEFCRVNDIKKLIHSDGYRDSVAFVDKASVVIGERNGSKIFLKDVVFPDFNFSVSYRNEKTIPFTDKRATTIAQDWTKTKKTFRYLNRVTFKRDDLPVKADISIVKNSQKDDSGFKKAYTMTEAGIFSNQETYDIELEVDNSRIGPGTEYNTPEKIEEAIRKTIKYVLSGLQGTNYPISIREQKDVLRSYMQMLHGKEKAGKPAFPSDFIGPQSYTLQMQNIVPLDENMNVPNIRKNYVVTEKADGDRALMYISDHGKIYLLNTGMNVIFTGAKTKDPILYNTLLDGELILHNKTGDYINLFTAFDVYYYDNQDVRAFGFISVNKDKEEKEDKKNQYRYPILKDIVKKLRPVSIVNDEISPLRITAKEFYPIHFTANGIFNGCSYIQKKIDDSLFEYNTDGLIFTPALFGVGADKQGKAGPLYKTTWDYSFKWKPAEFNTIDFLVTTMKTNAGEDIITPIFQDGVNNENIMQLNQYKTLVLNVGFDERKHGFINPCQDVIDDKLPDPSDNLDNEDNYQKQRFYPTKPYDVNAGLCKIMLQMDGNGVLQMKTEEEEVFGDMTIVEFRYEMTREEGWRWVPLRVRYDKTSELKLSLLGIGKPNYGNAYHVADSNWKSIHNPITIKMITTGTDIPENIADEDVYYNRQVKTRDTKALRDFHNLFVKKKLITGASKRGDILIDMACGKGGDFPKWISAHLSFVFGIDISKDNLENRLDGACARFLVNRRKFKNIPYTLFVNGDCRYNIRDGSAMLNDKAKAISKAVFGEGPREDRIGAGVLRQYGKGAAGFNVTSCQFAIHYFSQDATIFKNFMRNVAECTDLNGYFIGTSYDGNLVFQMLKNKAYGESIEILDQGTKIWEIRKQYTQMVLEDDVSSLGYQIDVFQESINKMIPEFLINYNYLNRAMENYGFRLITREEAQAMGLPEGSGLFSELYSYMNEEIKQNRSKKYDYGDAFKMTAYEKKISFLNRYFIYKKIRQVNAAKVTLEEKSILNELEEPSVTSQKKTIKTKKTQEDQDEYEEQDKETVLSTLAAAPLLKKKATRVPKKKLVIIDE